MLADDIADRIWSRKTFHEDYERFLRDSVRASLGVHKDNGALSTDALVRLLQSATHFSATRRPEYRESAYRIATGAVALSSTSELKVSAVAELVLARLGNFPGLDFLEARKNGSVAVPRRLWMEKAARLERNSVELDGEVLHLTDFQRLLWRHLADGDSVAVTAPTSAGKSFALQRYLANRVARGTAWGLYVVPTRALINQVSSDLARLLEVSSDLATVCTIPVPPSDLAAEGGIYVLTQERLQILFESVEKIRFDFVVIDEAQIIADGARGVLLETVLERLFRESPETQFLFGSPQTANPSVYQEAIGLEVMRVVLERESPVAQNLIFVDTDPVHNDRVAISFRRNDGSGLQLGEVPLPHPVYDVDQTLTTVAWKFGQGQKNLLYGSGQARCEKLAGQLQQLAVQARLSSETTSDSSLDDPGLSEFSRFLKEHIHPQYLLAETISVGIGFHYGNMPSLVRRTIEEFFEEGRLEFLVSTSTLLHGVNLPARNLFLLNPTKGRDWASREDIPITSIEFWNLAGRAGRLGKEFEGNVFLIDRGRWQSDPLEGEREEWVFPATTKSLRNNTDQLVSFINEIEHRSGSQQWLESTFAKIVNDHRAGRLGSTLDRAFSDDEQEQRVAIEAAVVEAASRIDVPMAITERHTSVSVYRLQEMLDYLVSKIESEGAMRFIPVHPLRPWQESHTSLLRLFKRIHSRFEGIPRKDRRHLYFAPLALRWMRGDPLARLIDDAYKYKQKNQKRVQVSTVIRNVMADIEQQLRFRYVKYTAAFEDVLKEAFRRTGHEELIPRIPPIPLFLELGASSKTMISLISLGLSRTAAGILSEVAVNKDMDRSATLVWLANLKPRTLGISEIVVRELRRLGLTR